MKSKILCYLLVLPAFFVGLNACEGENLEDIYSSCAPECVEGVEPDVEAIQEELVETLSVVQTENEIALESFETVLAGATATVSTSALQGRWALISAFGYTVSNSEQILASEVLGTRTINIDHVSGELTLTASDCNVTEVYTLSDDFLSFTVPADSAFFLNNEAIVVNVTNNIQLNASWNVQTIHDTSEPVDGVMYKVSDLQGAVGAYDGSNVLCYSYLQYATLGQQLILGSWVDIESNFEETVFYTDDSIKESVSLRDQVVNETASYTIIFNNEAEDLIDRFECFGSNTVAATPDYLSFSGSITIDTPDVSCDEPFGTVGFSLNALQ